jgi:hypothetical protein
MVVPCSLNVMTERFLQLPWAEGKLDMADRRFAGVFAGAALGVASLMMHEPHLACAASAIMHR